MTLISRTVVIKVQVPVFQRLNQHSLARIKNQRIYPPLQFAIKNSFLWPFPQTLLATPQIRKQISLESVGYGTGGTSSAGSQWERNTRGTGYSLPKARNSIELQCDCSIT